MSDENQSDDFWRKELSPRVFNALRLGVMEEKGTGAYVHTTAEGEYVCAGCKSPVFNSDEKIHDGSGYATFQITLEDTDRVMLARTYETGGAESTKVVCASCNGKLGTVVEDVARTADDLEKSTHKRVVHVSSDAIELKKNLSPKNYPFVYLLVLAGILLGVFFVWSWAGAFLGFARKEQVEGTVQLWVGNDEVYATMVHLDSLDPSKQSLLFGSEAFFIVLGKGEDMSQLKLTEQAVDVLWLDASFKVVLGEHKKPSTNTVMLVPPESASFGLVVRSGELPQQSFSKGFEIIVIDKTKLF